MAKSRSSKGHLLPPSTTENVAASTRTQWLTRAAAAFVTRTPANKKYYSAILELLWPPGHGIPGPHVSQADIRAMVDELRVQEGEPPYVDPFRRMRELQGEEGFHCIIKEGVNYQLINLDLAPKREPRAKPSRLLWEAIKDKWDHRCAHCGAQEPEVNLSPDHRRPRFRGGTNDDENWQPLCEQCNNIKSSTCQGCTLNCFTCSWAFPETYKPIQINDANKERIRRLAEDTRVHQSDLTNDILDTYFKNEG